MSKVARITNDGKLLLADELIEETPEPVNNINLAETLRGWGGGYTTNPETPNIYYVEGLRGGFTFPQAIFEVGETYALSFKIMKTSGDILTIGGHSLGFEDVEVYLDDELIGNDWGMWLQDTYPNDNLEHNYKVILTFNGSAGDSHLYVQINRNNDYSTEYTAEVYDLKLEKTSKKPPNLSLNNTGDMVILGELIEVDNKVEMGQILTNGNFDNGLDSWSLLEVQSGAMVEEGILKFTTTGNITGGILQNLSFSYGLTIRHQYYAYANVKYNGTMQLRATTYIIAEQENNGEWIRLSGVVTSGGTFSRPFGLRALDNIPIDVEVEDIFFIDLTGTFGEGNEPSKDDCDKMFSNYYQNGGYAELINDNAISLKDGNLLVNELIEVDVKVQSKNLVRNGNYEYGEIEPWILHNGAQLSWDEEVGAYLFLGSKNMNQLAYQELTLEPHTTYTLSLIGRRQYGDTSIRILRSLEGEDYIADIALIGTSLTPKSTTFLTEGQTQYYISFASTAASRRGYAKEIQLEKGDTASEYVGYGEVWVEVFE